MKNLMFALLCAAGLGACTAVSEERVGDAEKLFWEEGVKNPELVEHYGDDAQPTWDYESVVKIHGSVAPVYGQSGFVKIIKKRAAEWGCNAIYEIQRGSAKNTSYITSVSVGKYSAFATTIPITLYTPYGTFFGIRRIGWRPPIKEPVE